MGAQHRDEPDSFWEKPEVVEEFAARALDHRLARLVDEYADPCATRVLDLGCAGGRNTVLLAEWGFDVWAVDASAATIARSRKARVCCGPEDGCWSSTSPPKSI